MGQNFFQARSTIKLDKTDGGIDTDAEAEAEMQMQTQACNVGK